MRYEQRRHGVSLSRPRRYGRAVLEVLLLVGLVVGLNKYLTRDLVRGTAPQFQAQLLDGGSTALSDFRGRPLLLQFWATWCPVCGLEQRSINAVSRDHQVLTVSLDDISDNELKSWMAARGVSYPVARDPSGWIAQQYGVTGVPTSIIIDATGAIRFVEVGYTSETGLRLRLWWARK